MIEGIYKLANGGVNTPFRPTWATVYSAHGPLHRALVTSGH